MVSRIDKIGLAEDDAVTAGLAALGRTAAADDADMALGLDVVARFRTARRRRARLRATAATAMSLAAAVALAWFVVPTATPRGFEIERGGFLVEQARVETGDRVASGVWLVADAAPACLHVASRRVCGDVGTRLRVLDDGVIELGEGHVTADGALQLVTPLGDIHGEVGGMDVTFDAGAAAILVGAWPVTLEQAGVRTELPPGARVGPDQAPVVAMRSAAETAVTRAEAPQAAPADSPRTRPSTKTPRVGPAAATPGELLATAREQVGRRKLAAAEATYRQLLERFPAASESRTALVSLGRVQAERGRHAAALASFSRYLDGGAGPLGEEAHWGRIEALHAMGRADKRDRAIEALAAAHPRSVYLGKARALAGH